MQISVSENFPSRSVLINERFEILYLGEKVNNYLHFSKGNSLSNILDVINPNLASDLSEAISEAQTNRCKLIKSGSLIISEKKVCFINIAVESAASKDFAGELLLITFDERESHQLNDSDENLNEKFTESEISAQPSGKIIKSLLRNLAAGRVELHTAEERHQLLEEKLVAFNEELQTANEDLRETTEELRESYNQLQTLNVNLNQKVEEINLAKNDLQNLIAANSIATIFLDCQMKIRFYTPAAKKIFNLTSTDIGRPLADLTHKLRYPQLITDANEILGTLGEIEREVATVDGNNWFFTHFSPYRKIDQKVDGVVLNFINITVRKNTEQTLRQTEERLQMSQKLESVGRLAGGIAHDFNNMLTAIIGYSSLILKSLEKDHKWRESIEEIKKAGERSAALTGQLLAFSRKQVMQSKEISLNHLISDMEKMLVRLIGENISLITKLTDEKTAVKVDPGQMSQVVMNLIVNARDAMKTGGTLTMTTRHIFIKESISRQPIDMLPGEYVLLTVSDNGIGMDQSTLNHIFEPFYTTKKTGEGTGLGLATVYGIVKQFNGYITVESEIGRGTTFDIYLPALPESLKNKSLKSEALQ